MAAVKKQLIKDLKVGDRVLTFFVARHKSLDEFRDKSKGRFLTVVLADRSGHILARAWSNAVALADLFSEDDVIAVKGRVDEHLGRRQIIIDKLRRAHPDEKDRLYSEDDFVPQTQKNVDDLWATVQAAVEQVSDPQLKLLLQNVLAAEGDGLRAAPASKAMHHAYRGGLLEQTCDMLALASTLVGLYPGIDRDLLTAGIIVHGLGAVYAARYERDIDYSDAGRLIGAVVLADRLLESYLAGIPDLREDMALRLSHMILSYGGAPERGAVREPQTMEATALHLLYRLTAGVNHVQQVLDSQWDAARPWTEFDRATDRFYFRGRAREQEQEPTPEGPGETAPPPLNDEPVDENAPTIAERRAAYSSAQPPPGANAS